MADSHFEKCEFAIKLVREAVPTIENNTFAVVAPGLEPPNPVNLGITFSQLKPWEERRRKTQDITAQLRPKLFVSVPGVLARNNFV